MLLTVGQKLNLTETVAKVTTNTSDIRLNEKGGSGKLHTIVLYLAGQQASGIQALINLQCRAHSLDIPMVILEPIIPNNKFKAMPSLKLNETGHPILDSQTESYMRFSDLFDFDLFNKMSSEMGYPQLAPRMYFFETAPQKVIFIVLYEGEKSDLPAMWDVWPLESSPTDECFNPLTSHLSSDPKTQIYQIIQKGFCVIKVVLFRITRGESLIFTEDQLINSIFENRSFDDFTLVISVWMPKFVLPGNKGRECIHSGYHSTKEHVQPSKRLLADVKYYEDHFLNSNGKHLTLMIRVEHLYTFLRRPRSQYGQWTKEKCLDASIKEVQELQKNMSLGKPFVTLDIGKFGSKTLRSLGAEAVKRDTAGVNRVVSTVYNGEWDLKEWENSFTQATGGVEDSSYIAALQRTLASKSECLILVGGGMFQELTMKKYMENHDKADWCIRFLCIKDRLSEEVNP